MVLTILGVRKFPQKPRYICVLYAADSVKTEKLETYGLNPREFWADSSMFNDVVGCFGKACECEFDFNRHLVKISPVEK